MLKPLRWLSHTSPDAVGISLMLADIKIAAYDAAFHSALTILTLQRYNFSLKHTNLGETFFFFSQKIVRIRCFSL
jgi:hypothetical protein